MTNRDIARLTDQYVARTYTRYPIALVRGKGTRVWDADGKEYLDFLAGIAVNALGHCHPAVVRAIQQQSRKLLHVSNLYHIAPQAELARELCRHSFAERVFFCNSGAEANEAAFKLTRRYGGEHLGGKYEILSAHNSFHGRTLATLTATGQEKVRAGYDPLPAGFRQIPFNDLAAAAEAVDPHKTAGILIELVQGEGGVNVADADYVRGLRDLCDRQGLLLIFDEVQTGMGRTGKLFAYENYGVTPDMMTLAKALGGGLAVGAMLAREQVAKSFAPGSHASTFGGNPARVQRRPGGHERRLFPAAYSKTASDGEGFHQAVGEALKKRFSLHARDSRQRAVIGFELEMEGAKLSKVHERRAVDELHRL